MQKLHPLKLSSLLLLVGLSSNVPAQLPTPAQKSDDTDEVVLFEPFRPGAPLRNQVTQRGWTQVLTARFDLSIKEKSLPEAAEMIRKQSADAFVIQIDPIFGDLTGTKVNLELKNVTAIDALQAMNRSLRLSAKGLALHWSFYTTVDEKKQVAKLCFAQNSRQITTDQSEKIKLPNTLISMQEVGLLLKNSKGVKGGTIEDLILKIRKSVKESCPNQADKLELKYNPDTHIIVANAPHPALIEAFDAAMEDLRDIYGPHADRFLKRVSLKSGKTVVVAEGDFESKSIGSYSVRLYQASGDDQHPQRCDFFEAGIIRPRETGYVERVRCVDLNQDGKEEIVVIQRSVGTGNYLLAEAFSYGDKQLQLMAATEDLEPDADVISALKDQL